MSLRFKLRRIHQKIIFKRAIRDFKANYQTIEKYPNLIPDLVYGWGNMGWSSFTNYSAAIAKAAQSSVGPVVECGSGLSTILLGIIAQDKGYQVYTLEHHMEWRERVLDHLTKLAITSVNVCYAPIIDYDGFHWYDIGQAQIPDGISLVICDGPPHDTKGGRFGLLPVMSSKFANGGVILLDDYSRQEEKDIVKEWQKNYKLVMRDIGENDEYVGLIYQG
ncbi:MAG: class I SAM-dependent methyltransferase [Imperialibacter sp.]|uniref:hypothetical protein n=1 Tax=Imperialibacter sp. TaxID=2038411 RepID=UPI0032EBC421